MGLRSKIFDVLVKLHLVVEWIFKGWIYYLLLLLAIVTLCYLNFNGQTTVGGLIPYYKYYGEYIGSNFNPESDVYRLLYTFPMWGYGFIYWIFKSHVTIAIFQITVAFSTLILVIQILKNAGWETGGLFLLKFFFLFSFSWFIFHNIQWPYSLGSSFLILSLALLIHYLKTQNLFSLILSSILFGLMLNLRSDYFFFQLGLSAILIVLLLVKGRWKVIGHLLIWNAIILILLIPWTNFTKEKTDHRVFTSTNGGHVLFISLGQLPNNIWGITPLDKDSVMRAVVDEKVGKGARTLGYQADGVLKREWWKRIKQEPREYLRKCSINLGKLWDDSFYYGDIGSFHRSVKIDSSSMAAIDRSWYQITNDQPKSALYVSFGNWLRKFQESTAKKLILLSLILLTVHVYRHKWKSLYQAEFLVLLCIIGYQISLMTLGYYMRIYHNNIYIFYVIAIAFFLIEGSNGKFVMEKLESLRLYLVNVYKQTLSKRT